MAKELKMKVKIIHVFRARDLMVVQMCSRVRSPASYLRWGVGESASSFPQQSLIIKATSLIGQW